MYCHLYQSDHLDFVFSLVWTTIDRIFVLSSWDHSTNNNNSRNSSDNSISHKGDSIFLFDTVIGPLLLAYIVWIVQTFIQYQ